MHLRLQSRHRVTRFFVPYSNVENVRVDFRIDIETCRTEVAGISASGFLAQAAVQVIDRVATISGRGGIRGFFGEHDLCP
jgi:hypothetical protein